MHQKLKCNKCGQFFVCNTASVKLRGPMVKVSCPKCGELYERNFSKFVESQFLDEMPVLAKAHLTIALAQAVVAEVEIEPVRPKKKKV